MIDSCTSINNFDCFRKVHELHCRCDGNGNTTDTKSNPGGEGRCTVGCRLWVGHPVIVCSLLFLLCCTSMSIHYNVVCSAKTAIIEIILFRWPTLSKRILSFEIRIRNSRRAECSNRLIEFRMRMRVQSSTQPTHISGGRAHPRTRFPTDNRPNGPLIWLCVAHSRLMQFLCCNHFIFSVMLGRVLVLRLIRRMIHVLCGTERMHFSHV